MNEIFNSYQKAIARLSEALQVPFTDLHRDAAIQRFEFTAELAWKVMQKYLRDQRLECVSPKTCVQESYKIGLIEDDRLWLDIMTDRNITSYTYDEEYADRIYKKLPVYCELLSGFGDNLTKKLNGEIDVDA